MLKYALIFLFSVPAAAADLGSMKASDIPVLDIPAPSAPAAVRVPYSKAGYIQMTSSVKLKAEKDKGRLTIGFPKVKFGDGTDEDRAHLFVRITRGLPSPVISWATVLCSGSRYLGYKGSNFTLPEDSASLSVSETLALGYPKILISRTHPWLAADEAAQERLCSPEFLEEMKDFRAETLPQKLGDFSFSYESRRNTLRVTW